MIKWDGPAFAACLLSVADAYNNKRADLERAANSLADAVAQAEVFTGARAEFDLGVIDAQIQSVTQQFDIKNGGFGRSPKFPHSSAIDLVLERYQQDKRKDTCSPSPKPRSRKWPAAASTISSPADFTATRWMNAGSSRTSRK